MAQILIPIANIVNEWTGSYTDIDETPYNDSDYASATVFPYPNEEILDYALDVNLYNSDGSVLIASHTPSLTRSFTTYNFNFNTPSSYNDLRLQFLFKVQLTDTSDPEQPVWWVYRNFTVRLSNPQNPPDPGTNTISYRARKVEAEFSATAQVSWAQASVPDGTPPPAQSINILWLMND